MDIALADVDGRSTMVKNVTRIRYEKAGLLGIIKEVSMTVFGQNEPLTEAEFDRLTEFLKGCAGGKAMNVEELDGFFAALVAGPEVAMPSQYLPEVFGGEGSDSHEFGSLA